MTLILTSILTRNFVQVSTIFVVCFNSRSIPIQLPPRSRSAPAQFVQLPRSSGEFPVSSVAVPLPVQLLFSSRSRSAFLGVDLRSIPARSGIDRRATRDLNVGANEGRAAAADHPAGQAARRGAAGKE